MADKKEYPQEIALEAGRRYKLHSRARKAFQDGGEFAYQLATDGREELEKEVERLKDINVADYIQHTDKITTLQSQCTEKEKECEELKVRGADLNYESLHWKNAFEGLSKQIEELKAENERLKEQYGIMKGRTERAIKSLEESEKQFEQLQEAYNKLIGSD